MEALNDAIGREGKGALLQALAHYSYVDAHTCFHQLLV